MSGYNKIAYFGQLNPQTLKALSATALRVLMMLYHFSDKDGDNAFPGVVQLAQKCGVSQSTVKDALRRLKEAGCIEQVSRGGRAGDGRKWASNYSLRIPSSTSGESDIETEPQGPEVDSSTSESDLSTSGSEMSTSDSGSSQRPDLPSQRPENRPPPNPLSPKHVTPKNVDTQPPTSEPVTPSGSRCNWGCEDCSHFQAQEEKA